MESNRGFSPIRSVPASVTTPGVWKVVALPEEGGKSGKRGRWGREMHWREGRTYTGGGGEEEEQPPASLNQPRSEAEASFFLSSLPFP